MAGFMESQPRPTKTYHKTAYPRITTAHGFTGASKTVLITGGASGVGYSISKAFATAGASRIVIVSRSAGPQKQAKEEIESQFPETKVLTYQASITDIPRMEEILAEVSPVDVLVLNAAVAHRRIQATEVTAEEFRDAFETNVYPVFGITKAYLAAPAPSGGGGKTIVNVSTASAHMGGSFRVGYGPSKAAAAQVLQNFAAQVAYQGDAVRIFSYHPGSLYTPGTAQFFAKDAVEWEDVDLPAYFAVWLAGEQTGFLHGRHVWANWDVDELIALKEQFASERGFLTIGLIQQNLSVLAT